eukprot:CAMPEP_0176504542 /NCGR_PEP_ID=MMETSP0200_2-20121128/15995_1 /TAXON_ID=947934 /ORGANISM="Chaetoceros sp., Strain GSL56" /LENGTH=637 /DNA_ID=CAMNT_0017903993 /DNA_START=2497 /DNA_END=4410 /DNA_ORIENTATION=-
MTGVYYSFDIPAALHQQLKDTMTSSSSSSSSSATFTNCSTDTGGTCTHHDDESSFSMKFNLLYSVYSIPNIFLPFFGGTLVDSVGPHTAALIFASLTLGGQFLFALGTSYRNWNLMLLGRTFYGFGGESISVATSTLNHEWFQGKELALSFGINLAVSRLGSVVNDFMSPRVANEYGVDVAMLLGVGMNCMSVCMTLGICGLTLWRKKGGGGGGNNIVGYDAVGDTSDSLMEPLLSINDNNGSGDDNGSLIVQEENVKEEPNGGEEQDEDGDVEVNPLNLSSREKDDENDGGDRENGESETSTVMVCNTITMEIAPLEGGTTGSSTDPITNTCMGHIVQFDVMFWLLCLSCVVVYGCVLPFNNIASGILLERNYFTDPPQDCHLQHDDMCSMGDLAPEEGNMAMDSHGDTCVLNQYMRPIIPSSIHIYASNVDNKTISDDWVNDSYVFDHLTENDLDCGDAFWRNACTADYCAAQKMATEKSGRVMSIPYLFSAFLSPLFGHFVDRIGRRAILAVVSCVLLVSVHLSLACMSSSPVVPLVGQGLAYVGYAAVIWPSVPLTVRKESVGTAFGAMTAIQNVGLALFPLLIAFIYKGGGNRYIPNVEYFFVICASMGVLIGILLNILDRKRGGILNKASF